MHHTALVSRKTIYFNSKRLYINEGSLCIYNSIISILQFFIVCILFPAGPRFEFKRYITRTKTLIPVGYHWIMNYVIFECPTHISFCVSCRMSLQEFLISNCPKCSLIHRCTIMLSARKNRIVFIHYSMEDSRLVVHLLFSDVLEFTHYKKYLNWKKGVARIS